MAPPRKRKDIYLDNDEPEWFKKFKNEKDKERHNSIMKGLDEVCGMIQSLDNTNIPQDYLRNNLPEVTEERLEELLSLLKKTSLTTCQSFALTSDESGKSDGEKEWKDLNGDIQMNLLTATLDKMVEDFQELDALYLCRGLWAVKFILQPKWSNMSRNRRNKKIMRESGKST
ncbi:hypothetical protein INT48_001706 [Thamnidium elegans]|uniref:Uncharacterized protein n=1 Tax=Thamnidium elegans TaxID=101142 RepID=A0A8H7VVS6_9FUNG|nr:hypothetical protein INT48_001706 [Thamnidium elegans]